MRAYGFLVLVLPRNASCFRHFNLLTYANLISIFNARISHQKEPVLRCYCFLQFEIRSCPSLLLQDRLYSSCQYHLRQKTEPSCRLFYHLWLPPPFLRAIFRPVRSVFIRCWDLHDEGVKEEPLATSFSFSLFFF